MWQTLKVFVTKRIKMKFAMTAIHLSNLARVDTTSLNHIICDIDKVEKYIGLVFCDFY